MTKFFCEREVTKDRVFREVTKAVHLFSRHFWLSRPGGAELGKMTFAIEFVYENYNFQAQLVFLPQDPFNPRKTGVCEYLERPGGGCFSPPYRFSI